MTALSLAFGLLILSFLTWKISKGRNWARITLLVLVVVGMAPFIYFLPLQLKRSLFWSTVMIAQSLLQWYALFLVFTSPGKHWFSVQSSDQ